MITSSFAFVALYVTFQVFTPVLATYFGFLSQYQSYTMGGITLGQIIARQWQGYLSFFVAAVIGLVVYLIAAAHTEEPDTGVYQPI